MQTTDTTPADPDALAAMLADAAPCGGALDALQFDQLSTAGLIDWIIAWEKLLRHAHAQLIRGLGALARDAAVVRGTQSRFIEGEVTAALAWSPATAQARLSDAEALTRLFPDTVELLSGGSISVEQARALAQLTAGLQDPAARAVQQRVLPRMPGQSVAATRQAIRRAVVRADPQACAQRHRHEKNRRRVELCPQDDGMATLTLASTAQTTQAMMNTLTRLAKTAKRRNKGDQRTLDQCRADLLPALVLGTGDAPNASQDPATRPLVNVVVGIETLLGSADTPGELQGYGPICAQQARTIAHTPGSRWRFLLTSTDGVPVDATRTYTPPAALRRIAELTYHTCTFPHCQMPADRCDLDHGLQFHKGGLTSVHNLGPICRKHHNEKSRGNWDHDRLGDIILWTSKLTGRTYATEPTRYQLALAA
jgi:hypothetical protein